MTAAEEPKHLKARTVAAYLEDRLDVAVRAEVESHLAACVDCRTEVVEVGRLLAQRQRTRVLGPTAALAAAALVVLALGVTLLGDRGPADSGPTVRAPAPTDAPAAQLSVVTPAPDEVLQSGEDLRFVWNSAQPGSVFRVTLLDESGTPLWSVETGDTVVALRADVRLTSGASYFWLVDALAADGSTATSGARRFSVR